MIFIEFSDKNHICNKSKNFFAQLDKNQLCILLVYIA